MSTTVTTTTQAGGDRAALPPPTAQPLRLIRAEVLKIRTTSTWWWLALGALAATVVALAFNMFLAYQVFHNPEFFGGEDVGGLTDPVYHASNMYTSGQFFGLLLVMVLGILMVTNEFFHQTATATFLATPHRTVVIMSKLATAVLVGVAFWVGTTALDLVAGSVFFSTQDYGAMLGDWPVQRSILLNLAAYAVWTIFGVAIGTLIRSQVAAMIIATAVYVVGSQIAPLLFFLLSILFDNESLLEWQVVIPSVASQVMTSGGENIPGTPAWWVGALILLGYAVVAGVAGVLITRRRDIS